MIIESVIWNAYRDNPCRLFSIRELSLHLNKSYPLIHQHVTRLVEQEKLLTKKVGKSILCFPNYQHPFTILSLALADQNKALQESQSNPDLFALQHFFSKKVLPGLLSAWISNNKLILYVASAQDQSTISQELSKTTLEQEIVYLTSQNIAQRIQILVQKSIVLFGYEQYHLLVRSNYKQFASNFNMVNINE